MINMWLEVVWCVSPNAGESYTISLFIQPFSCGLARNFIQQNLFNVTLIKSGVKKRQKSPDTEKRVKKTKRVWKF